MPLPPTNLAVTTLSATETRLTWTAPVDALGNDIIAEQGHVGDWPNQLGSGLTNLWVTSGRFFEAVLGANESAIVLTALGDDPISYNAPGTFRFITPRHFVTMGHDEEVPITATLKPYTVQTYRVFVNSTIYREIPGYITQLDVAVPWQSLSVQAVSVSGATSALATISTPSSWARGFGGTGSDLGTAVAIDTNGDIVVAGNFSGSVNFGGTPLTSAGSSDMFIAKYSSDGTYIWSKRFGGANFEAVRSIALDANGDILVLGYFTGGSTDLGSGVLANAGLTDIFVAKYSRDGNFDTTNPDLNRRSWVKAIGAEEDDLPSCLTVDGDGNVIITGYFKRSVDFGGIVIHSGGGGRDTFLAKYSPTGVCLWAKNFWSDSTTEGAGVAVDSDGNIVLTGYMLGSIDLSSTRDPDTFVWTTNATNILTARNLGVADFYVAKFSPAGVHVWSVAYGSGRSVGVAVDSAGDVVIFGHFSTSTNLGGGTVAGNQTAAFLANYLGSNGSYQWARTIIGNNSITPTSVSVNGQNIYVVGHFRGTYNFGTHSLAAADATNGDCFLAVYSTTGTPNWAARFGGPEVDAAYAVTADVSGPVVTGAFRGTATFGSQSITSAGNFDIFLCRVAPPIGFARQFGGSGFAQLNGLAVDSEGNIFTGGVFTVSIDCGQGPLNTSGNQFALFLAKYSPAGQCLWQRRFTVTGTESAPTIQDIAVDDDGNIFLTGNFIGTANFGGSNLAQVGRRRNGFLVKLNSYGDHVWSKGFKNIDSTPDSTLGCQPISVKVDSEGNIIIAGTLGTQTTFNYTPTEILTVIGAAYTGLHTFIVKFTTDGTWVWERTFNCGADIYIRAMVIDSEDNIIVGGSFQGSVNCGGSDIVSLGYADILIAKLNSAGAHLWSRGGGGFASEEVMAVALDPNDNIYVGGHFFAPDGLPANFGGSDLFSRAGTSAWLAKYDPDGGHVWSQTFADQPAHPDEVLAMAVDSNDDLIVCGEYRSTGSFGGVRLEFGGAIDCWVAKYDSDGENQWTYGIHHIAGVFVQSDERMFAIAVDAANNIIGTIQSNAPSLTLANRTFTNSNVSFDGYLFKHGPTP